MFRCIFVHISPVFWLSLICIDLRKPFHTLLVDVFRTAPVFHGFLTSTSSGRSGCQLSTKLNLRPAKYCPAVRSAIRQATAPTPLYRCAGSNHGILQKIIIHCVYQVVHALGYTISSSKLSRTNFSEKQKETKLARSHSVKVFRGDFYAYLNVSPTTSKRHCLTVNHEQES